jgi:hypothetical protein
MEVKYWVQEAPDIDAVRPRTCPCCGAAAMPLGGRRGLVGHGIRERQVLGPWSEGSAPEALTLKLRRYRCRHREAIVTAAPSGLLRHVVYGAVAIAMALALWAHTRQSGRWVRPQVSPLRVGAERWHGWRSLCRWARTASKLWPGLRVMAASTREQALSAVTQLAARAAAPSGSVLTLACCGAVMPIAAKSGWMVDPPSSSVEVTHSTH